MKFVIAIEPGNDHSAWGVVVPDLPGCFARLTALFGCATNAIDLDLPFAQRHCISPANPGPSACGPEITPAVSVLASNDETERSAVYTLSDDVIAPHSREASTPPANVKRIPPFGPL